MKEMKWVQLNAYEGVEQLHDAMVEFRANRPLRFTAIHFSRDWTRYNPDFSALTSPDLRDCLFLNELADCLDVKPNGETKPAGSFGYLFGMVVYFERTWHTATQIRLPPSSCLIYLD